MLLLEARLRVVPVGVFFGRALDGAACSGEAAWSDEAAWLVRIAWVDGPASDATEVAGEVRSFEGVSGVGGASSARAGRFPGLMLLERC